MSDHKKKYIYFDDTLQVLAPIVVIGLLTVIFGLVFFG
jgi:hypothetical protein